MSKPGWTLLAVISLGTSVAAAEPGDDGDVTPAVELGYNTGGVRGVSEEWMILPAGQELGSELRLITSRPSLGTEALAFTDVAVLSLHARTSLRGKAELFASVDLLPKQPSWTDEQLWQGASLGLKTQIGKHAVAVAARGKAGPMIGRLGYWSGGSLGLEARTRIHDIMTFEGGVTGSGTYLMPRADAKDPAWLIEAGVSGSVLFRDPDGHFGGWVGLGYALPLAHEGRDPMSDTLLDPQPRLDLHLGGVVTIVDEWDVFADYAIIDRGDLGAMSTRLPILDGGFDQRQVIIGLNYHVKADDGMSAAAMIQR